EISRRFLRLDPGSLERLGRYEMALWRQAYQVIFVLDYLRRQNPGLKWLPRPSSSIGRFRPLRGDAPERFGDVNRCALLEGGLRSPPGRSSMETRSPVRRVRS